MSEKKALQAVREQIDKVDKQLQDLLNERTALAHQVAEIKQQSGEQADF